MINNRIIYTNSSPWIFNVGKAEGSFIWDEKGHKMIDFTSGWNVTNLGWNNPEIIKAVISQARKNTYNPMETTDPVQSAYAEKLLSTLPHELNVVARATGGTEANEEALKSARAFTKRKRIIGFKNTYHGQSFGTMSIGYIPDYVQNISPLVGDFIQLDYPDIYRTEKSQEEVLADFIKKLESRLKKEDVAAIVTEAGIITGWGSTLVAPSGYLAAIRKLTRKYGTLLILDEVGTGFSRTGRLWGMEHEGVVPDIVTLAKGISNGVAAIGAMVTRKDIGLEVYDKANLTSTFGWTPLACAAAIKTLELHLRENVWEKAAKDGEYLKRILKKELSDNPYVGNIDGLGMEIGLDLVTDTKSKQKNMKLFQTVIKTGREKGLLLNGDGEGNIQLMPPLTIERKTLDEGIGILLSCLG